METQKGDGKCFQSRSKMKSALKQKSDMKAESKKEDGIRAADAADEVKFTQKQLIRKLHIVEPVENVMCLIGKRFVFYCSISK